MYLVPKMAADEKKKKYTVEEVKSDTAEEKSNTPSKDESVSTDAKKSEDEKLSSFSLLDSEKPKPGTTGNDAADAQQKETPKEDSSDQKQKTSSQEEKKEETKQISSDEVKDWLKDVRPDTTKEQEKGGGKPVFKWIAFFMILLLVAGAIAGGIYYYRQNVPTNDEQEEEQQETPSNGEEPAAEPTSSEEPTETPTPEEEVELTDYSVNVLNGSGVAGQAGAVADLLTGAGFADPDTGNADEFNYTVTEIQVKEETPQQVVDEVTSALEDAYTVNVLEDYLSDDAEYDIVITVGEEQ